VFEISTSAERASVTFQVRVQPGASAAGIAGLYDTALKVRVRAPALENRANEELCALFAELLKRPKSAVRILSGERGRTKRIEILGVTAAQVEALLTQEA
jgi:uncharacterized protein (TIGR00251 family)